MHSRAVLAVLLATLATAAGCGTGAQDGTRDAAAARDAAGDSSMARDAGSDVSADAPAVDAARDAGLGPPYPVVLAHGFFGFNTFAGIDYVDYFFHVRAALADAGERQVYTPAVDPFNDSTTRGIALLAAVQRVIAETGAARVNIVGHSQGGMDARVVAALRPDLVATVTTVATPHDGTRVSDVVLQVVSDPNFRNLADDLVRIIGAPLWDALGNETSVFRSLAQFSTAGAADFARRYPDAQGVVYSSIAGRTALNDGGSLCRFAGRPDFITRWDGRLDPVDPLLSVSQLILAGDTAAPNDGLVGVAESRHGRFLGCIPADHLDEIGQILGDGPGVGNDFDHQAFYVDLVHWLRTQGY
jgi:triacylglycerol lipase